MKEIYNGMIDWDNQPCRAIDTETKQVIKTFKSRSECGAYFNKSRVLISQTIARNGCIRVNGKRIAIRNYHIK